MDYIKRVWSSLKNGVNADLTERTIIVGGNGAGKSAVVQAIELATTGQVSDVEGREAVKQTAALGRLFPRHADMFANAKTASGVECSWRTQRKEDGGFKSPDWRAPIAVSWPLLDLKARLRGDGNSVRTWIETKVSAGDFEANLKMLPPMIRAEVEKWAHIQGTKDLLQLATAAKAEARGLRAEATKSLNTIDRMMADVAMPLSQAERARLESLATASTSGVSPEEHALALAEVASLRHKRQELLSQQRAVNPDLLATMARINENLELIREHRTEFGNKSCKVCGNKDGQAIEARERALKAALESLGSDYKAYTQSLMVSSALATIEAELREAEQRALRPVADGQTALDAARRLAADDTVATSWRNAQSNRVTAEQKRIRADHLTTMAEQLDQVGRRQLTQAKVDFESAVTRYLPNNLKLGIDLDAARVGFLRDLQVHSAVSGGEESIMLLGLASSAEPITPISILCPDDRGWDPVTLRSEMMALRHSPHQVIIMATVMPEPVEGWSCLDLR